DTDSDGDGTPDCVDDCPNDPNKTEPGACGCGVADTDSDGDGTFDCDEDQGEDSNVVQWRVEDGGNGHWYQAVSFMGDVLSWEDAQSRAEEIGGHLATFTSEAETLGYLSADPDVNLGEAWIGLFQNFAAPDFQEPGGGWEWVTEEPLDWTNWDSNEPNNSTNNEFGGEHWGTLRINFGTRGAWNDYVPDFAGGARNGYIVEWSADCNGDGIVDFGQILDGTFADEDGNGVPDIRDPVQWRVEDGGNGHWYQFELIESEFCPRAEYLPVTAA
ncbi:MAG: hypothetical protein GY871_00980, partial [Actinomycetales bacterium]|nr:hypothetical protein [Actinomycetales bacterium]